MKKKLKIGIGTAQFGLNYGISNESGQTEINEICTILSNAINSGICYLDTAALYGNSEQVLGSVFKENAQFENKFNIITKTLKFEHNKVIEEQDIIDFEDTFYNSLENLNKKNLYGLMIHDSEDLFKKNGEKLWKKLLEFKKNKLVQKIGLSIYTEKQLDDFIKNYGYPDLVQMPANIFDQRFIEKDRLIKFKKNNTEIHCRSIFFQGLLLMDQKKIPEKLTKLKTHSIRYFNYLNKKNINKVVAALNFIYNIEEIDYLIIGLNNNQQLKEIIESINKYNKNDLDGLYDFKFDDDFYLNPSNWN